MLSSQTVATKAVRDSAEPPRTGCIAPANTGGPGKTPLLFGPTVTSAEKERDHNVDNITRFAVE